MLDLYVTQTRQLLANPKAPTQLYAEADLIGFINTARLQMAAEANCIRVQGTLTLIAASRAYVFSDIDVSSIVGVENVMHIRQARVAVGAGFVVIDSRPFPWFTQFHLNEVVPETGQPSVWAQYAQGVDGSIYIWPLPNDTYTLTLDCVCLPSELEDDGDTEAIPALWTHAVPYFAAYYAYLSSQRTSDAQNMYALYQEFAGRARSGATPEVLPQNYPQQPDPTLINKLGVPPPAPRG